MKRFTIMSVLLISCLGQVVGQVKEQKEKVEIESLWSVNYDDLFFLTAGYEAKLLSDLSLNLEGGLGLFMDFPEHSSAMFARELLGKVKANFLYYYNFKKRVAEKRDTRNNAANFITFGTEYSPNIAHLKKDYIQLWDSLTTYGAWGLRRNLGSYFTFQGEVGFGILKILTGPDVDNGTDIRPQFILNLQFSYKF